MVKEECIKGIEIINRVFPYGTEAPTFIQCTHGGCSKMGCPDCIGQCPLFFCQDTQCRKCKKDPWAVCEFHSEEDIKMAMKQKDGEAVDQIAK